jgi:transcriptional regulator with XRE-family HTH domain
MREELHGVMKLRRKDYGDANIVGKNIERLRKERGIKQKDFISKMQTMGIDINPTSYSKLEGQVRLASDREVYASAKILNVSIESLFDNSEDDLY